jgi:hypothetical protein
MRETERERVWTSLERTPVDLAVNSRVVRRLKLIEGRARVVEESDNSRSVKDTII